MAGHLGSGRLRGEMPAGPTDHCLECSGRQVGAALLGRCDGGGIFCQQRCQPQALTLTGCVVATSGDEGIKALVQPGDVWKARYDDQAIISR